MNAYRLYCQFILVLISAFLINDVLAQKNEKEIRIDTTYYKATPYKKYMIENVEYDEDIPIEYYNDITTYRVYKEEREGRTSSGKKTIFLLPGGGFVKLDNIINLDTNASLASNLSLAKKLVAEDFNVILVQYKTATGDDSSQINLLFANPTPLIELLMNYEQAKARMEEHSLKSFHDWRKIIRNKYDSASYYDIDTQQVFVCGISAGAFLTIYGLYLDSMEIPKQIAYKDIFNINRTINIDTTVRRSYYPFPKIAGIIPMSGGTFYKDIFANNASILGENGTPVYFMHGTCDEIVNQDSGRISYKHIASGNFTYNANSINKYPYSYGSTTIFNILKNTGTKIGYGQVCNGGHGIFINQSVNESLSYYPGGWDYYNTTNPSDPLNSTDPVFDNIMYFTNSVLGIGDPWETHVKIITPEKYTKGCISDPQNVGAIGGVQVFGGGVCNIGPYQDSVRISSGGERALLYLWKVGSETSWTQTTSSQRHVDCMDFFNFPYTYNNFVFTFKIPVAVKAISGCDTVEYYKEDVEFIAACIICRGSSTELKIIYDRELLKVNAQEEGMADILVSNMSGQPVAQWKQYLTRGWNDITDMPIDWYKQTAGMYIVSIHQSGTIYSGKIIKL
ncbi:MAG: T9SS type A sorting domain-containing protein [Chitinophagales bacterium]|nr:T9SS type A sorting domain-containing protein [Chitinophagales bacterium]